MDRMTERTTIDPPDFNGHKFITVLSRRWCVRCDLVQSWKGAHWYPLNGKDCPRNTPYAHGEQATAKED